MSDTPMTDLTKKMRHGAKCIYIAVQEDIARDISDSMTQAADRIEELDRELAEWQRLKTDPAFVWSNMVRGIIATPKEIAEAKRDAERYRWLRNNSLTLWVAKAADDKYWYSVLGDELDAELDAEIKGERK